MLKLWLAVWNCRRISSLCGVAAQQGLAPTSCLQVCFASWVASSGNVPQGRKHSSSWSDLSVPRSLSLGRSCRFTDHTQDVRTKSQTWMTNRSIVGVFHLSTFVHLTPVVLPPVQESSFSLEISCCAGPSAAPVFSSIMQKSCLKRFPHPWSADLGCL